MNQNKSICYYRCWESHRKKVSFGPTQSPGTSQRLSWRALQTTKSTPPSSTRHHRHVHVLTRVCVRIRVFSSIFWLVLVDFLFFSKWSSISPIWYNYHRLLLLLLFLYVQFVFCTYIVYLSSHHTMLSSVRTLHLSSVLYIPHHSTYDVH